MSPPTSDLQHESATLNDVLVAVLNFCGLPTARGHGIALRYCARSPGVRVVEDRPGRKDDRTDGAVCDALEQEQSRQAHVRAASLGGQASRPGGALSNSDH
jgi:hypothetical protein